MARIEIQPIEKYAFETELTVRITDINYGNHVGNDEFASLIHEARVRFLKNYGFSEKDINGKIMFISDFAVSYKSQAFYGDTLKFEVSAGDFNKHGCDLFFRATQTKDNTLVLLAKTGIVFFDLIKNKVATTPKAFSDLFL